MRVLRDRDYSVGVLTLVLIGVGMLLVARSAASAAIMTQFTDRATFNAAAINRAAIDFEGLAPSGGFTYYGTPGFLMLSGVTFQSNGPLFVQNSNGGPLGVGSRLTFQQAMPRNILNVTLPASVSAVGFNFISGDPVTITLSIGQSSQAFNIGTSPFPNFSFTGFTADEPIRAIQVASVGGADLDNFIFGITAAVPCHLYYPGTAIPEGFGVPWDVFNPSELLLKAFCTTSSVTADVGPGSSTRIIHTQGYQLNTATNQWEPFTYNCDAPLMSGIWCPGNATANLNSIRPSFLAHTCSWVNNAWQCGCRDQACTQHFWQLQAFQAPPSTTTTLVGTWTGTWQSLIPEHGSGPLTLIIASENLSLPGFFSWTGTLTKPGPGGLNIAGMPVSGTAFCQSASSCLWSDLLFSGTPPGESTGCIAGFNGVGGGLYTIVGICQIVDVDLGTYSLQKQ